MLYLMAIACPPLACLCAGRFLHSVLSFFMTLSVVLIPVAWVHAWMVVKGSYQVGPGGNIHIVNQVSPTRVKYKAGHRGSRGYDWND
jgi:hypothetical protein